MTRKPGDLPDSETRTAVGGDGQKGTKMTTITASAAGTSRLFPAAAALILGFGVIFAAGHLQASALHDAAHDVRHATGFPCH